MLSIDPVATKADREAFVRLPWAVNRGNPNFVPPILDQERLLIDTARHPFWTDGGKGTFYLARRDGRVVGRIAAIRNPAYEAHWKESAGFFGWYEAVEDGEPGREVTRALLEKVRADVKAWGLTHYYGPACPSSNYLYGALVEGYDKPPRLSMPYNPPFFDAHLTAAGLVKAKDLYAYDLQEKEDVSLIRKIAARLQARHHVTVRKLNMKKFDEEVALMRDIYNDVWSENWGFAPMSVGEFKQMAKELKPLADPDLILFAEIGGRPVGFSLILPDFNIVQRHMNGHMYTPGSLVRLLLFFAGITKIHTGRVMALGIRKEFRTLGIGTLFYAGAYDAAHKREYWDGEASWILEDNLQMNQALEKMKGKITRRYRIYRGEAG